MSIVRLCLCHVPAIILVAMSAGMAAAEPKPYDLDDPSEPWRTSRSGISSRVMPPYTPLIRKAIKCNAGGGNIRSPTSFPPRLPLGTEISSLGLSR